MRDLVGERMSSKRLADLFDAHYQRLYRLARRLSRDPEESRDLVQQAFLRAAHHAASIPDGAGGEAWLVRVLVNLCRDGRRRRIVKDRAMGRIPPATVSRGPDEAWAARQQVQAALARLSPRRRAVVVLRELEGRDAREVARLLGISQVTVRWHLASARREMKRFLRDDTGDEHE